MSIMVSFGGIALLALFIWFLNNKRDTDEQSLPLKLLGYYTLGLLSLTINHFLIPIGFVIALLMNPPTNKNLKRTSSIVGFIVMIAFKFLS